MKTTQEFNITIANFFFFLQSQNCLKIFITDRLFFKWTISGLFFDYFVFYNTNLSLIPDEASPAKAGSSSRRYSASMIHFYNDSGPREEWDSPLAKFVKHQHKVQKLSRNPVRHHFDHVHDPLGQPYKHFTLVNYDSRVVITSKMNIFTTLKS